MMYFIERVTIYSTSGKTRKGAAIQSAAVPFEHNLIDGDALSAIVSQFRKLVKVCNDNYRGAPLYLSWHRDGDSGQISIHPQQTGSEQSVMVISYAPVVARTAAFNVRDMIFQELQAKDPDIYSKYHMEATEGGEI